MTESRQLDTIAAALNVDLSTTGVQLYYATTWVDAFDSDPFGAGLVDVSPFRPVLVLGAGTAGELARVSHALARIYGVGHPISIINSENSVTRVPLGEADQNSPDGLLAIWIEPLPEIAASRAFSGLVRIVARLRAPGGCPWDQKQDAQSLINSLIEEAYEAVEAIEAGHPDHAAEELGDLLLLIAMEAQIAEESGQFTIEDVLEGISAKLIRRHPHVFGDNTAENAEDVVGIWQKVKASEGKKPKPAHPLDRYPAPMPIARRLIDLFAVEQPVATIDPEVVGDQLFALTKSAIEAGFNPEQLLLEAAKRSIPEESAS